MCVCVLYIQKIKKKKMIWFYSIRIDTYESALIKYLSFFLTLYIYYYCS